MAEDDGLRGREELTGRSLSLEQGYVHEVYENIAKDLSNTPDTYGGIVTDFLAELEPGSLVADIGCGDGRHLSLQEGIYSVGLDRSSQQTQLAHLGKKQESLTGDNLKLPYRNDTFDGVISVSVIHHLATRERRVRALRELARVLRIGGKLLIVVQSTQDTTGKESQDVLIPWFEQKKNKTKHNPNETFENVPKCDDDDEDEEDNEDDETSIVSSDDEDAFIPNEFTSEDWQLAAFKRREFAGRYQRNSLEAQSETLYDGRVATTSVDSCYAFMKSAFKRLSTNQSSLSSWNDRVEEYGRPEVGSRIPIEDLGMESSLGERTLKDNIIELRNLDDDLEQVFGQPSRPLYLERELLTTKLLEEDMNTTSANNKGKLVRSVSDFF